MSFTSMNSRNDVFLLLYETPWAAFCMKSATQMNKVEDESNLRRHSPSASWGTWPSSPKTTQSGCIPVRMRYGKTSRRPSRPFGAWSLTLPCSESTTTEDCRSSTQTTSCTWNCGCCSQRCVQGHVRRSGRSLARFAVTKTWCVCRSAVWVGWQRPRQDLDSEDLPGCHAPVQRRAPRLFRCQNDPLGPQVAAAFNLCLGIDFPLCARELKWIWHPCSGRS